MILSVTAFGDCRKAIGENNPSVLKFTEFGSRSWRCWISIWRLIQQAGTTIQSELVFIMMP